jgi:hypothetical protein
MVIIYFLDIVSKSIYPSQVDDMGYALAYRLRTKLICLAILTLIIPTILDAIKFFYIAPILNIDSRKDNQSIFTLFAKPDMIGLSAARFLYKLLIIIGLTLIVAIVYYLAVGTLEVLNASMDFLIGGPGIWPLIAYMLILINCCLTFFLFSSTFLWGYSWIQWIFATVLPGTIQKEYYHQRVLFFAFVTRSIQTLLLIMIINSMVNNSDKFFSLMGSMFKTGILLFVWSVICLIPYFIEKNTRKLEHKILDISKNH